MILLDLLDSPIKFCLIHIIFFILMTQEFAIFTAIYTQINKPWIFLSKVSQKKSNLHDTFTLWSEDGLQFILFPSFFQDL